MKIICLFGLFVLSASSSDWLCKKEKDFSIYYREKDQPQIDQYDSLIKNGLRTVRKFFGTGYKSQFAVYVHPDRSSLDSTWQHDFKLAGFQSECWMVASGISDKLDMIAPQQWKTQSCEHDYSNKEETQRLITHELVHVFHAQNNKSKDFSESDNLDWFAEGLATYVSGQLTIQKLDQVKQAVKENKTPSSLNDFWKGNLRYQLSGSTILFIDKTYGRKKLMKLLPYTKKSEVIAELNTSEEKFVQAWKQFLLK